VSLEESVAKVEEAFVVDILQCIMGNIRKYAALRCRFRIRSVVLDLRDVGLIIAVSDL
jgi:hypothetical protein